MLNGTRVAPNSQFHASAMLALPIVRSFEVRFWNSLQWHSVQTKFHQDPCIGSRVETCGQRDGETNIISNFMRVYFVHIVHNQHNQNTLHGTHQKLT
jgi:hypothetical protein